MSAVSAAAESQSRLDYAIPSYRPVGILRNPHVMTCALLIPRRLGAPADETVDVPVEADGSRVRLACHWATRADAPTVFLVHGFTGSANSTYMVGLARKAAARGWNVVRMNSRGSGGTEHVTWRLGHVGLWQDLAAALAFLQEAGRARRVYLVGYSMGGNMVLRLLGEWGSAAPVDVRGAVVVSPAVAVGRCASACDERPALRLYRDSFVRTLRRMLLRHAEHTGLDIDRRAVRKVSRIRGFDALYTVPRWGFSSVEDYWERASAYGVLDRVRVPTLVLAARDDVLVPFDSLEPLWRSGLPNLRFVGTDAGGHCAFVAGRSAAPDDPDWYWAENRALQFVGEFERRAACA